MKAKKLSNRICPTYKITVTASTLLLKLPLSGWLDADVTFDGETYQVRAEITEDSERMDLQLHANLPYWLADIVAVNLGQRWPELRDEMMDGLQNGTLVPLQPN